MTTASPATRPEKVDKPTRTGGRGARIGVLRPDPLPLADVCQELRVARDAARRVAKSCLKCEEDVALDGFRVRSGEGYLCSDCHDAALGRQESWQLFRRRGVLTLGVLAVLVALTALGSAVSSEVAVPSSPVRRR